MRVRVILIFCGALVVALTFTYPDWRPFLTGQTDGATFPGLSEAENDVYQLLSAEQRAVYRQMLNEDPVMALAMVRVALQPSTTVPLEQQSLPPMLAPERLPMASSSPLTPSVGLVEILSCIAKRMMLNYFGWRISVVPLGQICAFCWPSRPQPMKMVSS